MWPGLRNGIDFSNRMDYKSKLKMALGEEKKLYAEIGNETPC